MSSLQHYCITPTVGRPLRPHGFTVESLCRKRFTENTTPIAISVNFVVPFINGFNAKLEQHIAEADEPDSSVLLRDARLSLTSALLNFGETASYVAIQTFIATELIKRNTPVCNSIVYQWDMYPRLHQHYVGGLLKSLHLPAWLATLLGPASQKEEIEWLSARVSAAAAFQDGLARSVLTSTADLIVGSVKIVLVRSDDATTTMSTGRRLTGHAVRTVALLLSGAAGIAAGHSVSPGKGDYWGDFAGRLIGSFAVNALLLKLHLHEKKKVIASTK